jgi:acetyltransferase
MHIDIRRVRPSDAEALRSFYEALSSESRRARFLGSGSVADPGTARAFCTPDHMHDEGFVAVAATGALIGHLCLVDVGDNRLELGVAVADEWQGHGIGRRLFEAALDWARDRGVTTIVASCFADNWRVLSLLRSAPHPPTIEPAAAGVVDVLIPMRGPVPGDLSRPPYPAVAHNASVRRRRDAWRRTRRPGRVAAN